MLTPGSPSGTELDGRVKVVLTEALVTDADGTRGRRECVAVDQFSSGLSLFGPKKLSVKGETVRGRGGESTRRRDDKGVAPFQCHTNAQLITVLGVGTVGGRTDDGGQRSSHKRTVLSF